MTIKWTKDGKVDRPANAAALFANPADIGPHVDELADALDECVAALRYCATSPGVLHPMNNAQWVVAGNVLRKLGVEP